MAAARGDAPQVVSTRIAHGLSPHYEALRAIPSRRELLKSALYAQIQGELDRVLHAVEVVPHPQPQPPHDPSGRRLRIVAWNIQRGRHFDALLAALQNDAVLRDADIILMCEVDVGMGRSGNRHVARDLAAALRMHYAFAVSYLVLGDDFGENPDQTPNTLALAGAAVLSRVPIVQAENVDLPELRDKFSSRREKRLGKKRALRVDVQLPGRTVTLAGCHLDSNASPHQRALQLDALLSHCDQHVGSDGPLLMGGDLNTTTYDASGPWGLGRDLLHKLLMRGVDGTIEGYMVPERTYERPLFACLSQHGLAIDGFNDRAHGSYVYDVMSDYSVEKLHSKVGRLATRWLQWRLRKWSGVVPARLDWFAGRRLSPLSAGVVDCRDAAGRPVSDHFPIVVDIAGA